CREPGYPIGDLNYRRPVFVEKAFPEDEAVAATAYESARHTRASATELSIEKRIGRRGQVEVALPSSVVDRDGRTAGVGDVALEQTQALDAAVHGAALLGPTLYLPLSRRGHVALGVGSQLPVAGVRPFNWQLAAFLLWEYRDGPFWAW